MDTDNSVMEAWNGWGGVRGSRGIYNAVLPIKKKKTSIVALSREVTGPPCQRSRGTACPELWPCPEPWPVLSCVGLRVRPHAHCL